MEPFIEGKDYVKTFPDGYRQATMNDIISQGEPIPGKVIVVKSFYSGWYEKCRLSKDSDLKDLLIFLKHKHIFIK